MTDESNSPVNLPAELFREIADKIERNKPEDFGGAFMVVSPDGDTISGMLVGDTDLVTFWSLIKAKIDIAINTASDKQKVNRGFR